MTPAELEAAHGHAVPLLELRKLRAADLDAFSLEDLEKMKRNLRSGAFSLTVAADQAEKATRRRSNA